MNSMPTDLAWPGSERRGWPTSVSRTLSASSGVAAADTAAPQWRGPMAASVGCPRLVVCEPTLSVSTAVDQQRLQSWPLKGIAVGDASSVVHRGIAVQ